MIVVLVNGKPQIKRVETGLTDDVNVEIKSGLAEGDLIVTGSTTASKSSGSSGASGFQGGGQQGGRQGGGALGGGSALRMGARPGGN